MYVPKYVSNSTLEKFAVELLQKVQLRGRLIYSKVTKNARNCEHNCTNLKLEVCMSFYP